MPILHLVCGLPGSGKSTFARELEKKHPALRLTPDEWMAQIVGDGYDEKKRAAVEKIQWEIAQKVLSLGVDVILESGFWKKKERDQFRARAKELGATIKLYFLDISKEELWDRIKKRNKNLPEHTFAIKKSDLDLWISRFEPPTAKELK